MADKPEPAHPLRIGDVLATEGVQRPVEHRHTRGVALGNQQRQAVQQQVGPARGLRRGRCPARGLRHVTPTDWSLGIEARVRAFLTEGDAAESLYRESIARLGRTRVRAELARSHLLYGEWLRRERRRIDAREQLRTAHGMLDAMGIGAFAERARRELAATGETARKRTVETSGQLTAQEAQIARLARDGLSNPEIGVRLFISARTVKYHLGQVFAKLGISSRSQLDRVLADDPAAVPPR